MLENPKDVLKVGQEVTVKVLEVNTDERVSPSALEERPAQEEKKTRKRQSLPTSNKNKKTLTLIFQKLKLING